MAGHWEHVLKDAKCPKTIAIATYALHFQACPKCDHSEEVCDEAKRLADSAIGAACTCGLPAH